MKIGNLNEWKDKFTGKDMYDYHTGKITGNNIFDTSTTGVSFYNDLIPGSPDEQYYKKEKNLYGKIVNLTPQQYFEACVKYAFPNSSVDKLKQERQRDTESLETIKTVIDNGVQLPMTIVNIAQQTQEGLHRMYVVGEMFGWNSNSYPVLVVDYFDKEKQQNINKLKHDNEIEQRIKEAVLEACEYKYSSFEDFVEELQWTINSSFKYYDEFEDVEDIPFEIKKENELITVTVLNVPFIFNESDINISQDENTPDTYIDDEGIEWDFSDIDLDDMDISELLSKMK